MRNRFADNEESHNQLPYKLKKKIPIVKHYVVKVVVVVEKKRALKQKNANKIAIKLN